MENKGPVIINWTGDVRSEVPQWMVDLKDVVDVTLFTNMNDVEDAKKKGVNADFLQVGFDPIAFTPEGPTITPCPEILFLGSNYGNMFPLSQLRKDMVLRLKEVFGSRFGVFGNGWQEVGIQTHMIPTFNEEAAYYRSCKIAINLSHFDYGRYSSDRMFRIMGSGAFCLTHKYKDLEADFLEGRDLVAWTNIDELVGLIQRSLEPENDERRKSIASSGSDRVRILFTWDNFVQDLRIMTNNMIESKNATTV